MQRKREQTPPKCLKTISPAEFELLGQKFPHIIEALSDNSVEKLGWLFTLLSGEVKKNNSLFTLGYSFCLLDAPPQDADGSYNIEVRPTQGASLRPTTLARGKGVDALSKKTPYILSHGS